MRLSKLRTLRAQLEADPSTFTLRDVARLFGVCSFASRALRCQTAEYFSTFKYIRRKAARIVTSLFPLWELPANIWKTIILEWKRWCDLLLLNEPVHHPETTLSGTHLRLGH